MLKKYKNGNRQSLDNADSVTSGKPKFVPHQHAAIGIISSNSPPVGAGSSIAGNRKGLKVEPLNLDIDSKLKDIVQKNKNVMSYNQNNYLK